MSEHRSARSGSAPDEAAALRRTGAAPLHSGDPRRIGPYVPLALLGSGGMGRVYLARPASGGPGLVAAKVIRPEYAEDAGFRRRFEREASVHDLVGVARTPRLCGTGFEDRLLWMATEYLPALDLADAVREDGALATAAVWRLVAELGQALADLSAAGIVHRDLKPSNVLLSVHGAHVIDFGLSKAADATALTGTGNRVGTPAYMSPEHLRTGTCTPSSDVFSMGATLVYATTGHAPFGDGTGVDVMHRVAFEEPKAELLGQVAAADPDLATLLSACLTKESAARPTPQDLIDAASPRTEAAVWPEPLAGRVLARQRAYEVLDSLPAEGMTRLRSYGEPEAGDSTSAGNGTGPAGRGARAAAGDVEAAGWGAGPAGSDVLGAAQQLTGPGARRDTGDAEAAGRVAQPAGSEAEGAARPARTAAEGAAQPTGPGVPGRMARPAGREGQGAVQPAWSEAEAEAEGPARSAGPEARAAAGEAEAAGRLARSAETQAEGTARPTEPGAQSDTGGTEATGRGARSAGSEDEAAAQPARARAAAAADPPERLPAGEPRALGRRKPLLVVAAGVVLCAAAAGVLALDSSVPPVAGSSPGTRTSGGGALSGGARPTASGSPAYRSASGKSVDGGARVADSASAASAASGSAGPGPHTASASPAAPGPGPSDDPTGTTPATGAPEDPATPPWISDCAYYAGSGRTHEGDSGRRVLQVQCMLSERGYDVGGSGVDGEFGPGTTAAVESFQSAKGLDADGIVSRDTWTALRETD